MFEDELVDAAAAFGGFFGDFGALLVADDGVEHGDDADGVLDHLAAAVFVGGDAVDAESAQGVEAILQQVDAFEEGVGDDGLHDVELELTVVGGEGDADVVADDFVADLVHNLGDDGVDLAGHDGGAGLALGEVDFVEAAAGAGGEEAEVVAHLVDLDGEALHGVAVLDHAGGGGGGFDEVVGQGDVPAGNLAEGFDAGFAVAGLGADAGADGGGAHVDDEELVGRGAEVLEFAAERVGKAAEGLAEGHGDSVLQLGASHLHHVGELLALLVEGVDHVLEAGHEFEVFEAEGHVDGAGVGVVGGLGGVDHVVGRAVFVLSALVAHLLEGEVGDDLVSGHVGGGAGAALDHVDGKLVVVLAGDELVAGPDDGVALLFGDHAHLHVGHSGGLFGDGHATDEVGVGGEEMTADVKVFNSTGSLNAVEGFVGNFLLTKKVAFGAEFIGFHIVCCCYIMFYLYSTFRFLRCENTKKKILCIIFLQIIQTST